MKKIVIVAFLVIAVVAVALLIPNRPAAKSYPRNDVTIALDSSATALGAVLEDQRTVSGRLRADEAFGRVRAWLRMITTGNENPDDLDEYLVRSGTEKVTITSLSRSGDVHELGIRPSASSSKLSTDLKREVLKRLPGVDFMQ